jgi:hypothetical protein
VVPITDHTTLGVSMRLMLAFALATTVACSASRPAATPSPVATERATLAQVYFWRAKPGMIADYTRYVHDVAESIDHEAQRTGAFMSVTTYIASDTTGAWTHMRVFLLRDSTQLSGLSPALAAAGARLEPDSVRRRVRSTYAATLRESAGSMLTHLFR